MNQHIYPASFLTKYAELVVKYAISGQPTSLQTNQIVYWVPPECQIIRPLIEKVINENGYKGIRKENLTETIVTPVIYLGLFGDNLLKPLYSEQQKTPAKFEVGHQLLVPFPTPQRAAAAELNFNEYLAEVEVGLLLTTDEPLTSWQQKNVQIHELVRWLDSLQIQSFQINSATIQLTVGLGKRRQWLGATGHNLPSFEVFTSPDWQTVTGTFFANVSVNKYGEVIKNISLEFKEGELVHYQAEENQALLEKIISQTGMTRVGEFSLTDRSLSTLSRPLAVSIFDENIGGEFGNAHLALGYSYPHAFTDWHETTTQADLAAQGFNQATDHIDFINNEAKEVRATDVNGKQFLLYSNGKFIKD